jgi:hypothetical protein
MELWWKVRQDEIRRIQGGMAVDFGEILKRRKGNKSDVRGSVHTDHIQNLIFLHEF